MFTNQLLLKQRQIVKSFKTFFKTPFSHFFKKNITLKAENNGVLFIKPKLYADVNANKEKEYFEFEKMKLKYG